MVGKDKLVPILSFARNLSLRRNRKFHRGQKQKREKKRTETKAGRQTDRKLPRFLPIDVALLKSPTTARLIMIPTPIAVRVLSIAVNLTSPTPLALLCISGKPSSPLSSSALTSSSPTTAVLNASKKMFPGFNVGLLAAVAPRGVAASRISASAKLRAIASLIALSVGEEWPESGLAAVGVTASTLAAKARIRISSNSESESEDDGELRRVAGADRVVAALAVLLPVVDVLDEVALKPDAALAVPERLVGTGGRPIRLAPVVQEHGTEDRNNYRKEHEST